MFEILQNSWHHQYPVLVVYKVCPSSPKNLKWKYVLEILLWFAW